MKKLLRFSLMALFAVFGMSNAMAGKIVFADITPALENGVQYPDPFDGGDFTVTFAGGGNDGKYYTTGSAIRVYAGGTMTITATSGKLTKILITYDGTNKPTTADVVDGGTYDPETGLWTGDAETVVFTRPSGSGHWRIKEIATNDDVIIKEATSVKLNKIIYGGSVGSEIGFAEVTVVDADGNAIDGAEVTWTSKNQAVAVISGDKLQLLSEGSSSITATFAGNDYYKDSKASYTVNVLSTEAEDFSSIQETAPKTDKNSEAIATLVDFQNVTVTKVYNYLNSKGNPQYNVYLSDENHYGLMIYANGEGNEIGLEEGQVLNGQAYAKKMNYLGTYELVNFSKEGLTITEGTVEPIEMEIGEIDVQHQGALVTVKGVKFASYSDAEGNLDGYFSDGNYNLVYKDRFGAEPTLEDGETYDVTGIIINWSYTPCISPRTADDITLAASTNIQNLTIDTDASAPIYTLDGRRVDQNYRGVVIKNGKKTIQK